MLKGALLTIERREAVADEIAAWLRSGKEQVGKSWLDLGAVCYTRKSSNGAETYSGTTHSTGHFGCESRR